MSSHIFSCVEYVNWFCILVYDLWFVAWLCVLCIRFVFKAWLYVLWRLLGVCVQEWFCWFFILLITNLQFLIKPRKVVLILEKNRVRMLNQVIVKITSEGNNRHFIRWSQQYAVYLVCFFSVPFKQRSKLQTWLTRGRGDTWFIVFYRSEHLIEIVCFWWIRMQSDLKCIRRFSIWIQSIDVINVNKFEFELIKFFRIE